MLFKIFIRIWFMSGCIGTCVQIYQGEMAKGSGEGIMEVDFKKEFIWKYGISEFEEVSNLIDDALSESESRILHGKIWTLTLDVEKIHCLQYTHYISLCKEGEDDDEEVSLTFQNGINAGTVCQNYSLDGSGSVSCTKMEDVFVDIEPDWDAIERKYNKKPNKHLIQQIFDYHKPAIMELLGKQNYDNYVTGGGTSMTDKHYNKKIESWHDRGFYWKKVYETMEVDRNFV